MRPIYADALKEAVPHTHVDMFENCRNCMLLDEDEVRELIDNAPTVDAVPVVRCKDCKRRKNAKENGKVYWDGYKYYCEIAHYGVADGGFCFYGERKEDE